jgi:hypothetical protein
VVRVDRSSTYIVLSAVNIACHISISFANTCILISHTNDVKSDAKLSILYACKTKSLFALHNALLSTGISVNHRGNVAHIDSLSISSSDSPNISDIVCQCADGVNVVGLLVIDNQLWV